MPTASPLLLVFGGGDEDDLVSRAGNRTYVIGSSDLGRLLPNREVIRRLLVTSEPGHVDLSRYPVIVNMITEAEKSAKVLDNLKALLIGAPGRVINHPDAVLRTTRDQVAALLDGIPGLIVPKTVRLPGDPTMAAESIRSAGLVGPIIVRQVGTHTGRTVALHQSVDDAVAALEPGQEFIATQFVDFASPDGNYRKYRVFFIGNATVLRHMYVSDHWNVHSPDRARFMAPRPDIVAEERALIERDQPFGPQVQQVFREVRARMPLDFFGLDFGFTPDGAVLLFEANATMSFFPLWRSDDPQFQYLTACLRPAQSAFMKLVGQVADTPTVSAQGPGRPVP